MIRPVLAIIFLFFISCSKEKDGFTLVGKWEAVEYFDANTAWGGCSCWKEPAGQHIHELEFTLDGRFRYIYPPVSSVVGCEGEYEKKNDSTILWNHCSDDVTEAEISYQHPHLFIKKFAFGAYDIYKYKRVN